MRYSRTVCIAVLGLGLLPVSAGADASADSDRFRAIHEKEWTFRMRALTPWAGPGAQALSYKLGEYTLWQLRREAEDELGDDFDVRAFHDFILALGSVTLDILQDEVRAWVAEQR
jgi:hypothetical protein